jgi:hypothetical protein
MGFVIGFRFAVPIQMYPASSGWPSMSVKMGNVGWMERAVMVGSVGDGSVEDQAWP